MARKKRMKLREKTNEYICLKENGLRFQYATNVSEEAIAKKKIRSVLEIIAKDLCASLGPYGSTTVIQDPTKRHLCTKDGYDIISKMIFDDEVANTVLDIVRQVASAQVTTVGDGSTSAIVIASALYQALTDPGNKKYFRRVAPKDVVDILNSLSRIVDEYLYKTSLPVSDDLREIETIATVATNNDASIGKKVKEAYDIAGKYGFVDRDMDDKYDKDTLEKEQGIEWDRGYIDKCFAYDRPDGVVKIDDPLIFIFKGTITYDDLAPLIGPVMGYATGTKNRQLIIVANAFDDDVITFFKTNRLMHLQTRNIIDKKPEVKFTVVDIDSITASSKNAIEDLALMSGCRVYDKFAMSASDAVDHDGRLTAAGEAFIGVARKATVTQSKTTIICLPPSDLAVERGQKAADLIEEQSESIKEKLDGYSAKKLRSTDDEVQIFQLKKRLSHLEGCAVIYHIGGESLAEKMSKDRLIEDAIYASHSAIEHGYIPGGNLMIPKILSDYGPVIADRLRKEFPHIEDSSFFPYFVGLIKDAFLESYRHVLDNSYLTGKEVDETIGRCISKGEIYNLKTHGFESFSSTRIINSTETDSEIMKSCISIIGLLATSNQFITNNLGVKDLIK
jgi:chaperonin GroEL